MSSTSDLPVEDWPESEAARFPCWLYTSLQNVLQRLIRARRPDSVTSVPLVTLGARWSFRVDVTAHQKQLQGV
jgi:hypothetical protein